MLTKPSITIKGQRHELDPYCSITIREIGDLSCDPTISALQSPPSSSGSGGHLVGYSIGIVLALSAVVTTIITAMIIAFCTVRRHRAKKATESDATRYEN